MTILGFNPNHHGSVCLLEDGELKFFIQEERITKTKYDNYPFVSFINLIQNFTINSISWGAPSIFYPHESKLTKSSYWVKLASKFNKTSFTNYLDLSKSYHHTCHVAHAFYNSGFKESIGIVIDGLGSAFFNSENQFIGQETESIFKCSYPNNFKILHKTLTNPSKEINLSRIYETITMHLGWNRDEAGKTMGLAPYGKSNPNIPNLFKGLNGNPDIFFSDHNLKTILPDQTETFVNEEKNSQLKLQRDPREWHYNESKITDLEKDLAWKVQNDTQQLVGDYIEKAIKETGLKQVCCAGGYFLNCVTNYYLLKRFPEVEFYFEPIANDSGTAIGSAKLLWHNETQDTTIRPLKSLYLGKQYSKEELLEGIKKYVDTPQ